MIKEGTVISSKSASKSSIIPEGTVVATGNGTLQKNLAQSQQQKKFTNAVASDFFTMGKTSADVAREIKNKIKNPEENNESKTTNPHGGYDKNYLLDLVRSKKVKANKEVFAKAKEDFENSEKNTFLAKTLNIIGGLPTDTYEKSTARNNFDNAKKDYFNSVSDYLSYGGKKISLNLPEKNIYDLENIDSVVAWLANDKKGKVNRKSGWLKADNVDVYNQLEEHEKNILFYLYQEDGSEAAKDFLDYIMSDLNMRATKKTVTEAQKFAQKAPLAATLTSHVTNLGKFAGIGDAIVKSYSGEPLDVYSSAYTMSHITNAIRNQITSDLEKSTNDTPVLKQLNKVTSYIGVDNIPAFVYQAVSSSVDSAVNFAISKGLGAAAGFSGAALNKATSNISSIIMGSQVAQDSIISAKQSGLSDSEAVTLGIIRGSIEGITEKYSIDAILDNPGSILGRGIKSPYKRAFIAEGSEEVSSNWLNRIADALYYGDNNEIKKNYSKYISDGNSEAEAFALTVYDLFKEDASSFIAGGMSGMSMSLTNNILSSIKGANTTKIGKVIAQNELESEVINVALTLNENSEARQLAQRISESGNMGVSEIGQLALYTLEELNNQKSQAISNAVYDRVKALGGSAFDANTVADYYAAVYSGKKVSKAEANTVKNNRFTEAIWDESEWFEETKNIIADIGQRQSRIYSAISTKSSDNNEEIPEVVGETENQTPNAETQQEEISNTYESESPTLAESTDEESDSAKETVFREPTDQQIYREPTSQEKAEAILGERKNAKQRHIVDVAEKLDKDLKVVFVPNDSKTLNGQKGKFVFDTKTMYLAKDLKTSEAYVELFKHEFVHRLELRKTYSSFKNYLFNKSVAFEHYAKTRLRRNGTDTSNLTRQEAIERLTNMYMENFKGDTKIPAKTRESFTREKAEREAVADFVARTLFKGNTPELRVALTGSIDTLVEMETDLDLFSEMAKNDRNLLQKIIDAIRDFINDIKGVPQFKDLRKDLQYLEERLTRVYNSADNKKATAESGEVYQETKFSGDNIDIYTEKQYNNFGWVRANNILSPAEYQTLLSRYADYKHNKDKYPTTRFGEAVIFSFDYIDVIMYVKGTIKNPQINKIVRIVEGDYSDKTTIQERIIKNEHQQKSLPYETIEKMYGEEYIRLYNRRNNASFREYISRQEGNGGSKIYSNSGKITNGKTGIQSNKTIDSAGLNESAFSMPENESYSSDNLDTNYIKAVNNGDMETAQRLVDEAAKAAGYDTDAYHGTNQGDFTVFDWDKTQRADGGFFGRGHYFTKSEGMAKVYGERIVKAKLKLGKTFVWSEEVNSYQGKKPPELLSRNIVSRINMAKLFPDIFASKTISYWEYDAQKGENIEKTIKWSELEEIVNELSKGLTLRAYSDGSYKWHTEGRFFEVPVGESYQSLEEANEGKFFAAINALKEKYDGLLSAMTFDDQTTYTQRYGTEITEALKKNGYSSAMDTFEGGEIVVFNSEQIKSANPVTYDDNGNVIPLSERFNTANEDIRYSSDNIPNQTSDLLDRHENGEITREQLIEELDKLYAKAKEVYGTIKPGEKRQTPADVAVPKAVADDKPTEQFIRTLIETGKLTQDMVDNIDIKTLLGDFSYKVVSDKSAIIDADAAIKNGTAETLWAETVNKGAIISKNQVAVGERLLADAISKKDTLKVLTLASELADAFTRAGQVVQAARLIKKMTGVGKMVSLQQTVNTLNKNLHKKYGANAPVIKISEHVAKLLLNAKSEEAIEQAYQEVLQDVASQMPVTFLDKWNAWRYFAMLANPKTHVRNFFGNLIFLPAVRFKNLVATGMEKAFIKDTSQRTKSVKIEKEYKEFAKKDGQRNEVKQLLKGRKYTDENALKDKQQIFKAKAIEFITQFNSNALEFEDMLFKNVHYINALAGYLQARNVDLKSVSEDVLENARTYAVNEARKATFNDDSVLARKIQNLADENLIASIAVEGVLPFKRTPINIVKRGVEYSPIGLMKTLTKGVYDVKKGKISATEFIDGLASAFTGTSLMLIGVLCYNLGLVSGGEKDDEESTFEKWLGKQEYAATFGDKSYTIDWTAPACIPFFIGVETATIMNEEKDFSFANLTNIFWNALEPITNLSMLSGMQSVIESAKYAENSQTLWAIASDAMISYGMQPLPSTLGALGRTIDPTQRSWYIDKNSKVLDTTAQTIKNNIQSKIPGLSYTQTPKIDAWGRTVSRGGLGERVLENFVSPGYFSETQYTSVDKELKRIFKETGENVFPKTADKSFSVNKETKYLTAQEYVTYAVAKGQYSFDYVNELINSSSYGKLSDDEKAQVISNLYKFANAKAKAEVSDYDLTAKGSMFKTVTMWERNGNSAVTYYIYNTISK